MAFRRVLALLRHLRLSRTIKRHCANRVSLVVELLGPRIAPVVGGLAPALPALPGGIWDGVVRLTGAGVLGGIAGGTGSLLERVLELGFRTSQSS